MNQKYKRKDCLRHPSSRQRSIRHSRTQHTLARHCLSGNLNGCKQSVTMKGYVQLQLPDMLISNDSIMAHLLMSVFFFDTFSTQIKLSTRIQSPASVSLDHCVHMSVSRDNVKQARRRHFSVMIICNNIYIKQSRRCNSYHNNDSHYRTSINNNNALMSAIDRNPAM